jgi:hypothetical protein
MATNPNQPQPNPNPNPQPSDPNDPSQQDPNR